MRTFTPKQEHLRRAWLVVDAEGLVLGRLASEVASRLAGKHKPVYAPHVDTGDHVVVVNVAKVVMTSDKAQRTRLYRHSGYPGGLHSARVADLLTSRPEEVVRHAIRGMLPKGRLGRQMLRKLKLYAGPSHPHAAQMPQPLELPSARRAS